MSEHVIRTEAQLRAVIGDEVPGLQEKNRSQMDDFAYDFLARSPFAVLCTADADGRVDASPKGDAPGFALVEDAHTLVVPDRPGNKLAYGHLNILANPEVGLLFMIPGTRETLRINGRAELTTEPALLERLAANGKPAVLAIRVHVRECFFHCAKAFIRSGLWKPDTWPEDQRISFGAMYATYNNTDQAAADALDAAVAHDYENNL